MWKKNQKSKKQIRIVLVGMQVKYLMCDVYLFLFLQTKQLWGE